MPKVDFKTDPLTSYIMSDAYMLWALEAAEEVVGKDGLSAVLRDAGLDKLIENYPPDNLEPPGVGLTYGDYARLNAGLLNFFGRPGKGMVLRIGRISARKGIEHQSQTYNLATVLASKMLPAATQIKMGLAAMITGWKTMNAKFGQEFVGSIEDGGDHWRLIIETDSTTVGLKADTPIGWLIEGAVEEAGRQVFGKFFDVEQLECRSMGAPASVWKVPKQPTEE